MSFRLEAACGCNTGRIRKNNEDNFFFNGQCLDRDNNGLEQPIRMNTLLQQNVNVVVFDGMGGENYGEYASYAAASCMKEFDRNKAVNFSPNKKQLVDLCQKLNSAVVEKSRELCTERMGSTMVGLFFAEDLVYVGNLGDSRAYRLRGGEFLQLSEDHVDKREAQTKKKAPLTQHLGINPEEFLIEPYVAKCSLRAGDQYLLCSDGLTDMLSNFEINDIMFRSGSAEDCVSRLIEAALEKGGRDNITVIVCRIHSAESIPADYQEDPEDEPTVVIDPEDAKLARAPAKNNPKTPAGKKKKAWVTLLAAAAVLLLAIIAYFTVHVWNPATCTEPETCKICGKTRGEALEHNWGEWELVTEPTCTEPGVEQRLCLNDPEHAETREVPAAGHTWKDPTCTEPSVCTICGAESGEPIGHAWKDPTCTEPSVCTICGAESGEPIGHDWGEPEYIWSEDLGSVTATRVCRNDAEHVESETVETTGVITSPAVCEEMGLTTYTAVFSNPAFGTQEKTATDVPAPGHDWGEAEYIWKENNAGVTATRICRNDAGHVETETVETISRVSTPATCGEAGQTTFTAVFSNPAFSTQEKTVTDIPALDHDWSEAEYVWAEDHSSVTATRICRNDADHVETETASTTSAAAAPATCGEMGWTRYTAEFVNPAFSAQEKAVADVPALGHAWGEAEYVWAEDNSSVTATRICRNDAGHVETETVETRGRVSIPATCEKMGTTLYTAEFANPAFSAQEKTAADIPAFGHDWGEAEYYWTEDLGSVRATRVCRNDPKHVETEKAETTQQVSIPATCEEMGTTLYTAEFENPGFETQEKTVEDIPALGHAWGEPEYVWSDDNSSVTATRTCLNDASHAETETVETGSEPVSPATCEEMGTTLYTAVFENPWFETQEKTVEDIPALGHDWSNWILIEREGSMVRYCRNDPSHKEKKQITEDELTAETETAEVSPEEPAAIGEENGEKSGPEEGLDPNIVGEETEESDDGGLLPGWERVKLIAAGGSHGVGVKESGKILGISLNGNVKEKELDSLTVGEKFILGVKSNNRVWWIATEEGARSGILKTVEGWKKITALAIGDSHVVGLRKDGLVRIASEGPYLENTEISTWQNIVAVAASGRCTFGVTENGEVLVAGMGKEAFAAVEAWSDIEDITAGRNLVIGLKADGTVCAAGPNSGDYEEIKDWTDIIAIAAADDHVLCLKSDGTALAAGGNGFGQCDVSGWTELRAVAAGNSFSLGLREDGTVYYAGS